MLDNVTITIELDADEIQALSDISNALYIHNLDGFDQYHSDLIRRIANSGSAALKEIQEPLIG